MIRSMIDTFKAGYIAAAENEQVNEQDAAAQRELLARLTSPVISPQGIIRTCLHIHVRIIPSFKRIISVNNYVKTCYQQNHDDTTYKKKSNYNVRCGQDVYFCINI